MRSAGSSRRVNLIGPRPWHLELACWDLIGKDAGTPVYELLGGTGEPVRAYASTGEVRPAEARIDYIKARLDEGFEAVELRAPEPADVAVVRELRELFPDLTLMVDANQGWTVRVMEDRQPWDYKTALSVAREEVFGPVVSVHTFAETDVVVRRANDTEYGLAAGLWTEDLERAHTVAADLEAGSVWVNNYLDMLDPAPRGGFKQSGIGRELSKEALDAYRQVKTVKMTFGEIPKF